MTELVESPPTLPSVALQEAAADAERYVAASHAPATWVAYESDWRVFTTWCQSVNLASLPAESATVVLFLSAEARREVAPATLRRRLAAIRFMHAGAKVTSPGDVSIRLVMKGIKRRSAHQVVKKEAVLEEQVKQMVDATDPDTLKGKRDRALVLLGFAGALRRSELVALDVEHLRPCEEGYRVLIAKSKTDQEGEGQGIAIPREPGSPYCPVQAVAEWLSFAAIDSGAIFRRVTKGNKLTRDRLSGQTVSLVVKELADAAGFMKSQYSGHSLRSGFLTSAARQNASLFKMAAQSRHKSMDVLCGYVRERALFENHAGAGLLGPRKNAGPSSSNMG